MFHLSAVSNPPQKAFSINAAFTALAIAASILLRQCLKWENAKMDKEEAEGAEPKIRYIL
jgi:hypothetical protein